MLLRPSESVLMYLNRAVRSRELAHQAATRDEHEFHARMESSWMNLAASTALVERVDLSLHTIDGALLPYDACRGCHGLMSIETVESFRCEEIYTFKCHRCGSTEQRRWPR